ncbi:MAG: hypothetical protein ACFFDX_11110 [Candidatus Odinarchaeota archaeon]
MSSKNILKSMKVKINDIRENRIKLDNLKYNFSKPSSKQIKKENSMDAKIKHRKKREGD